MPIFGATTKYTIGAQVDIYIAGSRFTCPEGGIAQSITVWMDSYSGTDSAKCAIYNSARTALIGSTEVNVIGVAGKWQTFNFIVKPTLVAGTAYFLAAWGNAYVVYDDVVGGLNSYGSHAYNGWPADISGDPTYADNQTSIYCTYSTVGTLSLSMGMGTGVQILSGAKGGSLPKVGPGHKPSNIGF
jgi:hypothetical protein